MIPAIGSIPTIPTIPSIPATPATGGVASSSASGGFSQVLGGALTSLQQTQSAASNTAIQGVTGQANVADVMVSAAQATLATNLTVAVRDKAVGAFNQIMAMQF